MYIIFISLLSQFFTIVKDDIDYSTKLDLYMYVCLYIGTNFSITWVYIAIEYFMSIFFGCEFTTTTLHRKLLLTVFYIIFFYSCMVNNFHFDIKWHLFHEFIESRWNFLKGNINIDMEWKEELYITCYEYVEYMLWVDDD